MARTVRVGVKRELWGYIDIMLNDEEERRIFDGTTILAQRRRVQKVGEEYVSSGGEIHWDAEAPLYIDNWFMEIDEKER